MRTAAFLVMLPFLLGPVTAADTRPQEMEISVTCNEHTCLISKTELLNLAKAFLRVRAECNQRRI